ncbi:MAG: hypothetical protein SFV21_18560 [Rhodospirillaceae bacterium]|nr:hypothetical protein [Rhodospirillaceae bacterium]
MADAAESQLDMKLLAAVLNALIPAGEGYPGAGHPAIAAACVADAALDGALGTIANALARLPTGFAARDAAARERALSDLEAGQPAAFASLLRHTYNAYYADAAVRAALETDTGYPARPPHYEGYELVPFDPGVLEKQRQRAPFWRDPER